MADDFLIVNKKILPDYLPKVIRARALLDGHEAANVTAAVRMAGISRSTYYKYKDYVFLPEQQQSGRKAVINLVLKHAPGSLSAVLKAISDTAASVLTISQSIPIAGKADVTISLDTAQMAGPIEDLLTRLKDLPAVRSVRLSALE